MKIQGIVLLSLLLNCAVFFSCGGSGSHDHDMDSSAEKHVHADSSAVIVTESGSADSLKVFTGLLPCADCEQIETSVSLYNDYRFQLHRLYYGRKSKGPGSNEISETGTWMKHGTDTIHLQGLKDQPSMFIETDSSLIQLDMQGKRIEGKLAEKYALKRIK